MDQNEFLFELGRVVHRLQLVDKVHRDLVLFLPSYPGVLQGFLRGVALMALDLRQPSKQVLRYPGPLGPRVNLADFAQLFLKGGRSVLSIDPYRVASSREHLVHDDPNRPDVHAFRDLPALGDHLWGHVYQSSSLGYLTVMEDVVLTEAEIDYLDRAEVSLVHHQDVRWLQISVDDVSVVNIRNRLKDALYQFAGFEITEPLPLIESLLDYGLQPPSSH